MSTMFAKITALTFLAVGHCQAAEMWIRGANTCVGTNTDTPKTVMYGPCTGDNKASSYISQELVGGGVTSTADNYWAGVSGTFEAVDIPMTNNMPTSYATRAKMGMTATGQAGCEYAAAQASVAIGTTPNTGTFQYAGAISTGTAACTLDKVRVAKPKTGGCSDDGCALTPEICVAGTGTTCTEKSYPAGQVKFSAGFAADASWAKTTIAISGGGTNPVEYFGYRLKYDFSMVGTGAMVYFNGDKTVTLTNLASTNVASFTVQSQDGTKSVTITTGGMYTYGDTGTTWPKKGSWAIKVRAAPVSGSTTSMWVDFLFDADHIGASKWVLYDPVVDSTGGVPAGSANVIASAVTVTLFAVAAAFVGF